MTVPMSCTTKALQELGSELAECREWARVWKQAARHWREDAQRFEREAAVLAGEVEFQRMLRSSLPAIEENLGRVRKELYEESRTSRECLKDLKACCEKLAAAEAREQEYRRLIREEEIRTRSGDLADRLLERLENALMEPGDHAALDAHVEQARQDAVQELLDADDVGGEDVFNPAWDRGWRYGMSAGYAMAKAQLRSVAGLPDGTEGNVTELAKVALEQARDEGREEGQEYEMERIEAAWGLVCNYDEKLAEAGLWYTVIELLLERVEEADERVKQARAEMKERCVEIIAREYFYEPCSWVYIEETLLDVIRNAEEANDE